MAVNDHGYTSIVAWGRIAGSYEPHIQSVCDKALAEGAPRNAVYRVDSTRTFGGTTQLAGTWVTTDDITNAHTREQMGLDPLPEPEAVLRAQPVQPAAAQDASTVLISFRTCRDTSVCEYWTLSAPTDDVEGLDADELAEYLLEHTDSARLDDSEPHDWDNREFGEITTGRHDREQEAAPAETLARIPAADGELRIWAVGTHGNQDSKLYTLDLFGLLVSIESTDGRVVVTVDREDPGVAMDVQVEADESVRVGA